MFCAIEVRCAGRADPRAGVIHLVCDPLLGKVTRDVRAEGDAGVLPQVQEVLKSPGVTDLLGNLAGRVEMAVVESVTGGNVAMREALTRKLADMRADLNGPDFPGLDGLFIGLAPMSPAETERPSGLFTSRRGRL